MGLVVKMPTEANTAEEPSTMLKGVCQKMFISTVGRAELFHVDETVVSRMLHTDTGDVTSHRVLRQRRQRYVLSSGYLV